MPHTFELALREALPVATVGQGLRRAAQHNGIALLKVWREHRYFDAGLSAKRARSLSVS